MRSPLAIFLLALVLLAAPAPCPAMQIVGGIGAGGSPSLADGIGLGSDNRSYVFLTSRHFLSGHFSNPGDIAGIPIVDGFLLSSPAANGANLGFRILELASDLPGINPLPIAFSPSASDYLNLDLRPYGIVSGTPAYGYQNSGANLSFTLQNDAGLGGPPPPPSFTFGLIDNLGYPGDAWLMVDLRGSGATGDAFLTFGDSNSALLADLGGGQLAALGTANGIFDPEDPLRTITGLWADTDVNFYNFAPNYIPQIQSYLAARSLFHGETFTLSIVPLNGAPVIPEPSRPLLLAAALLPLLLRRRRP